MLCDIAKYMRTSEYFYLEIFYNTLIKCLTSIIFIVKSKKSLFILKQNTLAILKKINSVFKSNSKSLPQSPLDIIYTLK